METMTTYDTKIEFSIPDELLPSNDTETPFNVISFAGGRLLAMEQIQMTGSPGSLEIIDVSNVEISSCSFRYIFHSYDVRVCHGMGTVM